MDQGNLAGRAVLLLFRQSYTAMRETVLRQRTTPQGLLLYAVAHRVYFLFSCAASLFALQQAPQSAILPFR
jgi:hypothetical protein